MRFKVLHLIGSNVVGGPEKQILHHAVDMQGSDYAIEIGSFHDLSEPPEVLEAAKQRNIPTVCLSGGVRLGLVEELSQVLRERKGHLLCTHGFKANVVGYLAASRTGTRHIAVVRGWTAENLRVAFYEILERQALKRAQWVVCVSGKQAERIARMRGGRTQPIVVPNAMLPPFSRPDDRVISREALSIPPDAFVFGSVGRLSPEKGHRFMISAFRDLCATANGGAPLRLIVVGNGREQAALEEQASQLGIREHVLFTGFQGNPGAWMKLLDCMVQPSLTEGTPNAVLEAMCLSVPVIATSVGGVPDLISDGYNGLLVPAADPMQLSEAMKRMLLQPELRREMQKHAAVANEEYSPAKQRQRFIAAYELAFQSDPKKL